MKNGTSEFKQSKILGLSPQAFCKYVSAAFIGVGLIFLTEVYKPIFWLVSKATENPSVTGRFAVAVVILSAFATALYKFPIFRHILLYAVLGLISFVGIAKLGAGTSYSGEPYVSIWAPILVQLGVISLIVCKIREQRIHIRKAIDTIVTYQGVFLIMLYGLIVLYAGLDHARHWEDGYHQAVERIKLLHPGQDTVLAEIVEANGVKFVCAITNGTANCT